MLNTVCSCWPENHFQCEREAKIDWHSFALWTVRKNHMIVSNPVLVYVLSCPVMWKCHVNGFCCCCCCYVERLRKWKSVALCTYHAHVYVVQYGVGRMWTDSTRAHCRNVFQIHSEIFVNVMCTNIDGRAGQVRERRRKNSKENHIMLCWSLHWF